MLILEGRGRPFLHLYHNEPNLHSKNSIKGDIKPKFHMDKCTHLENYDVKSLHAVLKIASSMLWCRTQKV